MKRIVLVGGGTGGHFYPLMATAERLRERSTGSDLELYYFGPEPYNQAELDRNQIKFVACPAGKRRRYASLANFTDPFKTLAGLFVALYKLFLIYPDVVFSKGGYTSVPVVLAAGFLRIPVVIHESDSRPGRANRLAAKWSKYVAVSFPEAADLFPEAKTLLTGVPIRRALLKNTPNAAAALGLPEDVPLIFVTGGSLGAERLNTLILDTLDELLPHYLILHQTGDNAEVGVRQMANSLINDENLLGRYFVKGSLTGEEMALAQSAAHLIISRAGGGSIFEIASHGKPSILIPIPEEVSHDQRTNAYSYARSGAASVIEEANLRDGLLAAEVERIMNDSELYQKMSQAALAFSPQDAAATLAGTLLVIADEHG